jgi:hypothetical protein
MKAAKIISFLSHFLRCMISQRGEWESFLLMFTPYESLRPVLEVEKKRQQDGLATKKEGDII